MKEWLVKIIVAALSKLISEYITEEMLQEWEQKAKQLAYDKLKEFADSTEWTEIDDALVEKIGKSWGVIE